MIRMSTGHMEGTLQLLYVLLTDCYVYLLRKGACHPLSPSPPHPKGLSTAWRVAMKMLQSQQPQGVSPSKLQGTGGASRRAAGS